MVFTQCLFTQNLQKWLLGVTDALQGGKYFYAQVGELMLQENCGQLQDILQSERTLGCILQLWHVLGF